MSSTSFRTMGQVAVLGALVLIVAPWLWVTNLSEPASLSTQLLFLSQGLLLGAWLLGIGVALIKDRKKYAIYGTAFSALGISLEWYLL